MVLQDFSHEVGAQPTSSETRGEDVGVHKHLHETSAKMSLSVRYPRASAKGITRLRKSSNWLTRSWRRRASRAISLRFRPLRALALSSIADSSSSIRIVRVVVFMYYNVTHMVGRGNPTLSPSGGAETGDGIPIRMTYQKICSYAQGNLYAEIHTPPSPPQGGIFQVSTTFGRGQVKRPSKPLHESLRQHQPLLKSSPKGEGFSPIPRGGQ